MATSDNTQAASGLSVDVLLTDEERAELRNFIRKHGDRRASELLGLSRQTLTRLAAGLAVHRATITVMRSHLRGGLAA